AGDPPPTLLFDEVEGLCRAGKNDRAEAILALLNSGYRKGQTVPRVLPKGKDFEIQFFPTYCPKVLACIGNLSDTITSRSIVIPMQRRAPHERIDRFNFSRVKAATEPLRERLKEAMVSRKAHVQEAYDRLPDLDFLRDR